MINLFSIQNGYPHGAIPFDKIPSKDFLSLIEKGIEESRSNIDKIKQNTDPATFQNTIEALEFSGLKLDRISSVFFNLLNCCSDEVLEAAADQISTLLASFSNDVQLDATLFSRIKYVFENQKSENLNREQIMVLKKYYEDFVRNGALLSDSDKEKLRALDTELAQSAPKFGQNLLKATNNFLMEITDEKDLAGLPPSAVSAAKQLATEKGKPDSWMISLHAPSYIPFMTYAENRELRKKLWTEYGQRSFKSDEFSNKELCESIATLRGRRAQLLGYNTHADFVLSRRMASNTKTVYSFLNNILEPAFKAAKKEIDELKAFKNSLDGEGDIMPWDFGFYSEKFKEKLFNYSDEDLRPYFQLESVIQGVFQHAGKLFQLKFNEAPNIPVYHPDVKVFEVTDANGFVGLLYFDVFPRENKRGGAWMTTFLEQGTTDGKNIYRPHVSIVCNFTKPTKDNPSLLTFNEVQTLFHEFGHGLHSLLSKCHYPSVAGTNVLWDFVELPSQIMENWSMEKETLSTFAKHYKTGAPLPDSLYNSLKASKNFLAGFASLRQVSLALIDLAWHDVSPDETPKTHLMEEKVMAPLRVLPKVEGTNVSVSFSHIFAGGYSAGYYSYKWAEVLDADAFDLFSEKGIYDPETAKKFRDEILSRGGTDDPATLFRNFRGRDPDTQALLRRSGLIS
jgi:peptidyl-dipeptidase Dcp